MTGIPYARRKPIGGKGELAARGIRVPIYLI